MNSPRYKELKDAVKLLRQYLHTKLDLDYSTYSTRELDNIIRVVFKDGKLKDPNHKFAKYEGHLLLGCAGYLTEVILKNTTNAKLLIDETDEKWYLNFTLKAENNSSVQPMQQVKKRTWGGNEASLYDFCMTTIKTFNEPKSGTPGRNINFKEVYYHDHANKKPWWKFW